MGSITLAEAEEKRLVRNRLYQSGTSLDEQFIYRSVIQIFPESRNRVIDPLINMEFDIEVPELKLYVEYNGIAFHSSEEKIQRDKIKELHCKKINKSFIQIVESEEVSGVEKTKENDFVKYYVAVTGNYKTKISNLITIIEDIFSMYQLQVVEIDYLRSLYEAFLISSKYQYKIKTDASNNIIGKDYMSQVYCEYETMEDSELQTNNKKLAIKEIQPVNKGIISNQYEMINTLIFNGESLSNCNISPAMNYQKQIESLEDRKHQLDRFEDSLKEKESALAEKERDLGKKLELMGEKEQILEKRYHELNKLEEEVRQREYFYRENIEAELLEREKALLKEKEDYKSKLDARYRKRKIQLDKEYEDRHQLLDSYCDKRIAVEVENGLRDIRRVANEQVELLREQLRQQKIMASRQQISQMYHL